MTVANNPATQKTAAEMLRLSRFRPTQLEMLGDDVDLTKFFITFRGVQFNMVEAVTDIVVERTIEGASTVTATVQDQDRILMRSGLLGHRLTTEIDGLFFVLVAVQKNGSTLTLTFEDREIYILRTYDKPIKQSLATSRGRLTRAQFILRMLREVKELPPIPYVIPELKLIQPIGANALLPAATTKANQRGYGIPSPNDLKVKSGDMTEEQRRNAQTILDVGASMLLDRSLLVMAMMTVIQESSIINLPQPQPGAYNFLSVDPTRNPVGCFQQIKHWGWPASRNVATDASAFYGKLVKIATGGQNTDYAAAIERVQNSGNGQAYAQWRTEAERIVTAYGLISGTTADANATYAAEGLTGDYEFYRGLPPQSATQKKKGKATWGKENSWECMQRLANEVQWRCFFVSGTFYYISEDDLFKSQPIAVLDEDAVGIMSIDGDYDEGKKNGTVTIVCHATRWVSPPGSVIQLQNMGPWNGRWLVSAISRSLFDPTTSITLKKPLPKLPEPSGSNLPSGTDQGWNGADPYTTDPAKRQYQVATALVQPVPSGHHNSIVQGPHDTAGLPGFPAIDFGADAGAPVIAVENGKVTRLSGHDPSQGPWDPTLGIHGPFGLSVYLQGDSGTIYYYTHLGSTNVVAGAHVLEGTVVGTVGNYAQWGGVNHVHVGVATTPDGHPDEIDLMNAPLAKGP